MSFIGNAPAAIPTSFQAVQADSFNGNGSTTDFTLSRQITNLYDIEVLVDNVQQSPYDGSYSVNGTTITFSSAPGSGTNNIYIVYRDHPITSIAPKGQEIELFSSGGGTFTVTPASSATDRTLTLPDEAGTVLTTAGVPASAMPAGSVLQVVQDVLTTQIASNTGSTLVDIGLQVQLTPSAASNKFLVSGNVFMSSSYDNMSHALILQRSINGGSFSNVGIGTNGGISYGVTAWWAISGADVSAGDGWQLTFEYLDSPSTASTVDYRIMARAYSGYMYINRNVRSNHATFDLYPISTITVKEIAS